jgi:hypothetical protein
MPTPLHLSDEEMDLLLALAAPIDQRQRPEFLAAVAAELEANSQSAAVGIGSVHRVAHGATALFRSAATAQRGQDGARLERICPDPPTASWSRAFESRFHLSPIGDKCFLRLAGRAPGGPGAGAWDGAPRPTRLGVLNSSLMRIRRPFR